MKRKIIQIDAEKCNGCGLCADACHEGAIGMADGKARLLRDDYCDGLGDCLPVCPEDAIRFVEREAAAYDAEAVKKNRTQKAGEEGTPSGGCPGTRVKSIGRQDASAAPAAPERAASRLSQWPVQIRLVPAGAPYFDGADLLVAADCTAYAYGGFHEDFIKGRIVLVGCPKLDDTDYADKLAAVFRENEIRSVTVARMEVPCCGGLEQAVKQALLKSGKEIPCQVVTISTDGRIL